MQTKFIALLPFFFVSYNALRAPEHFSFRFGATNQQCEVQRLIKNGDETYSWIFLLLDYYSLWFFPPYYRT